MFLPNLQNRPVNGVTTNFPNILEEISYEIVEPVKQTSFRLVEWPIWERLTSIILVQSSTKIKLLDTLVRHYSLRINIYYVVSFSHVFVFTKVSLLSYRQLPLEVVAGVLHDCRVAVRLVATIRDVHVELAGPRHKAMAHVFRHGLVLIQFPEKHALVESVYLLDVAEYYVFLRTF